MSSQPRPPSNTLLPRRSRYLLKQTQFGCCCQNSSIIGLVITVLILVLFVIETKFYENGDIASVLQPRRQNVVEVGHLDANHNLKGPSLLEFTQPQTTSISDFAPQIQTIQTMPPFQNPQTSIPSPTTSKTSPHQTKSETTKHPLKNPFSFIPSRGYTYQMESCLNLHHFAKTRPLHCEYWRGERQPNATVCGGVHLIPGACYLASKGKYLSFSTSQPLSQQNKPQLPWCGTHTHGSDMNWKDQMEDIKFGEDLSFSPPSSCSLLEINSESLVQSLGGKVILILGDSHARNFFLALVNHLRNLKYMVERHQNKYVKGTVFPSFRLTVWRNRDELWEGRALEASKLPRTECGSDPCVTFYYIWSGDQTEWDTVLSPVTRILQRLKPNGIVTPWLSQAYLPSNYNASLSQAMHAADLMTQFLVERGTTSNVPLRLVVSPFPFDRDFTIRNIRTWLVEKRGISNSLELNRLLTLRLVPTSQLLQAHEAKFGKHALLRKTWHTLCATHGNYCPNYAKCHHRDSDDLLAQTAMKVEDEGLQANEERIGSTRVSPLNNNTLCDAHLERVFVAVALSALVAMEDQTQNSTFGN